MLPLFQEPASNADCFNPGYVLNGDQLQPHSSAYSAGDVINFSSICPSPYTMHGANSTTCSKSGNWTDLLPTCTVRCATPIAPTYARFSTGQTLFESYSVSDEVHYECNYEPTRTDEIFVCGYYGVWETGKGEKQCPGNGLKFTSQYISAFSSFYVKDHVCSVLCIK